MKTGVLRAVSIVTTSEAEDAVAELVGSVLGAPPAAYHDLESGSVTVSAYLPGQRPWSKAQPTALKAGLQRIKAQGLDLGPGRLRVRLMPKTAWAQAWKRHFQPLVIGTSLLIRPSWSHVRAARGAALVVLDPGLSFGTGQHPTTEFCLRQIVRQHGVRPASFLDLGTGSGILAIAAAKLNYHPIVAFDLDPDAIRVATENALRNRVADRIQLRKKDVSRLPVRPKEKFTLVCANLIASLLVDQRDRIVATLAGTGCLVLAGILDSEFGAVRETYERAGLRLVGTARRGEWRSGSFTRINLA